MDPLQPSEGWETNYPGKRGHQWTFYAANADQGLLYHYPKFEQQQLTQLLARQIVNFGRDPSSGRTVKTQVWNVTSVWDSPLGRLSKRRYKFTPRNCNKHTNQRGKDWPGCVPPYSDFCHFTGGDKPWKSGTLAYWRLKMEPRPGRNGTLIHRQLANPSYLWWKIAFALEAEFGELELGEWVGS